MTANRRDLGNLRRPLRSPSVTFYSRAVRILVSEEENGGLEIAPFFSQYALHLCALSALCKDRYAGVCVMNIEISFRRLLSIPFASWSLCAIVCHRFRPHCQSARLNVASVAYEASFYPYQ